MVALAAAMRFDGYILNILLQAATFSIAVFGLSVVLGLCGQINLAQAAFFGFGAYAVGLGTADLHLNFWLCLLAAAWSRWSRAPSSAPQPCALGATTLLW